MNTEKISLLLALARELHASLTPPAGLRDFDTKISSLNTEKPFVVTAWADSTYVFGMGATPEDALAKMIAEIPPRKTAADFRAEAAALLAKADALDA